MLQAGITALQVSNRTVKRFLCREGFQYLQVRKKGVLLEGDLLKRKQFAKKTKKDYNPHVWQNSISFFFMVSVLSINIMHLIKPGRPRDVFGENNVKVSYGCTSVEAGEG